MQVEASRFLVTETLFHMHPSKVVLEHPLARNPIGHHHTQFYRLTRLGRGPGNRQMAAPIGLLGQPHIGEVAAAGLDAQLVKGNLTAISKGNQCRVGQADHVAPVQGSTELGPLASVEAVVGEKGYTLSVRQQFGNVAQYALAHLALNIALARHHLPRQRQGPETVRERQPEHLQVLVADKAAIQDDPDLASLPEVEHLIDERVVQAAGVEGHIHQPVPNAGDPGGFFGHAKNVERDLAEMNRQSLNQPDDDPDPVAQAAPVEAGMHSLQLLSDAHVYFLAVAHALTPTG